MSSPFPTLPTATAGRFFIDVRDLPCPRLEAETEHFTRIADMEFMEAALATMVQQALGQTSRQLKPRGAVLFFGPSGSGKTTLTSVLTHGWAKSTGRMAKLVRVDAHSLASGEFGQSQKNVRKLFDALGELCKPGDPVFAAVDEFETMATNRNEISGQTSPIDARNSVNALLERLDESPRNLFLLATTNVSNYLDAAVLDRVDFAFSVDLPDAEARMNSLDRCIREISPNSPSLDKGTRTKLKPLIDLTDGQSFRGMERLVRTCIALNGGDTSLTPQQLLSTAQFLAKTDSRLKGTRS